MRLTLNHSNAFTKHTKSDLEGVHIRHNIIHNVQINAIAWLKGHDYKLDLPESNSVASTSRKKKNCQSSYSVSPRMPKGWELEPIGQRTVSKAIAKKEKAEGSLLTSYSSFSYLANASKSFASYRSAIF